MVSSSNWLVSLKVALISTGVVSLAMLMKLSIPSIRNFAVCEVPAIWSTLLSWLKPPYLYVIINGIIITIAATSRFHHKRHDDDNRSEPSVLSSKPPASDLGSDVADVRSQPEFTAVESPVIYESEAAIVEVKPVLVNGSVVVGEEEEDEFVISKPTWTPPQTIDSPETQPEIFAMMEKPLVSTRFVHWKPMKSSPEGGRALRVARPKTHRQETLESTWKMITEGRHMPLTRHQRKLDTWENHGRHMNPDQYQSPPQLAIKSETVKDRTNYGPVSSASPSPVSERMRREPSPSQDELNRRVEAFIKKFNEEMRLQRQESLNQYMEMINRGAH